MNIYDARGFSIIKSIFPKLDLHLGRSVERARAYYSLFRFYFASHREAKLVQHLSLWSISDQSDSPPPLATIPCSGWLQQVVAAARDAV